MRGLTEHSCRTCGTVAMMLDPVANWECFDCIRNADEDEHYVDSMVNWAAAVTADCRAEWKRES